MSTPGPSRLSTTDLIGPVLIFLGGFLLAVAIALPTLFVDNLRTIPLSTDLTTTADSTGGASPAGTPSDPGATDGGATDGGATDSGATDSGATDGAPAAARILDRCSLNSPTARVVGADLTRQQRVVAVRPADARRVTLQAGTSVRAENVTVDDREVDPQAPRPGSDAATPAGAATCTDPTVTAVRDRVTINRTTALPDLTAPAGGQPGSSEIQYDSNAAPVAVPDRRGYTYLLPFDVSTTDHTFFDVTTRRSVPLRHTGEVTVHGRDAARFVADVPDTDLHQIRTGDAQSTPPTIITRPAGWFGLPGVDPAREVTATLHHRGSWELDVDTATGTILNARIVVDESYRQIDPSLPDHRVTNLSATFSYDETTQRRMSNRATALASPVTIWGRVIPLLAAIAGIAAIGAGLAIINPAWRPRRPRRRQDESGPEPGRQASDRPEPHGPHPDHPQTDRPQSDDPRADHLQPDRLQSDDHQNSPSRPERPASDRSRTEAPTSDPDADPPASS
ncbi:DUF3068 domain-containing protein [Gordonia sp. OPL2]|uniref:DUF3068 domain-containing protein n=1 Tax=Gordonia sp. OPL2 TaxID=2486274 RepID=UPI0016555560|nr:DUF3068 domain-containing protein [Gordonia sp. OPL2]ROZ99119.1 DUF3068 domain-containing protein [Gordonia sp. OPL2]